jgi:hypothetical protein
MRDIRGNADKLSNYLFDQIGKYVEANEVTNNEMIATLMMMLLTLIGSLKTTKEVKLEMIDQHFKAIRHAVEATEDKTHQ